MKKITDFIVKYRNVFLIVFIFLAFINLYISKKVNINDDIMKYLPKSSETKIGKDIMDKDFPLTDSSELNVMFKGLSKTDKTKTLTKLEKVKGVSSVTYDNSKNYNKGKYTLYTLNVNDYAKSKASKKVYETIKNDFKPEAMSGSIYEEYKPILQLWIVALAITSAMIILILLSESYVEPFLYLISIGIAVFINKGTNIMFNSVSSVTNSITAILQLALSMDYSIMLSNRFKQEKKKTPNKIEAMKSALYHSFKAISSSSVTTIVGLLALVFMSFTIGKDLGFVLSKGVLLSLISIFCCLPALLIIFDNLIAKTRKKSLKFNLTKLGAFSYKTRYIQILCVIALFITAFLLKGNINILYTGHEQDEVGKVFPANNQIAIVYNNKYEEEISNYCLELEKDKNIDQVLCYGNTISDELKYNELNNKFSELGQDVTIDENLLKILYYNYFNKDNNEKMTLYNFIKFIENDIYTDDTFGKNIKDDVKSNLELLNNFADSNLINKKRTIKDIANILSIDVNDVDKIMVLYNSKNNKSKMTINTFINFLLNNVSNDENYSSYINSDTKAKLKDLQKFTDAKIINTKYSSKELAKIFSLNKNDVDKLLLLYKINEGSNSKLSLFEFSSFALKLSNQEEYKSLFSDDTISSLKLLNYLSNKDNVTSKLTVDGLKEKLNNLSFNIDENTLKLLYVVYNGSTTDKKLTINSFATIALNLSTNNTYKNYFNEEIINNLNTLKKLTDNYNNTISSNNLYSMFNITGDDISKINYAITGDVNGTYSLTPLEFVELLVNNDQIKESLSEDKLSNLNKALYIMSNAENTYTSSSFSKSFDLDEILTSVIFGVYLDNANSLNEISVKDMINFIYLNKDNNLVKNYVTDYTSLLKTAKNILDNIDNKFSYLDMSKIINQSESTVKSIYGMYEYLNSEVKISPYELTNVIIKNKDNDQIKQKLSSEKLVLVTLVNEVMKSTINNKKYSAVELSKLLSIDKDKINIIYSLYDYKNNKNSSNISLNKFIKFIKSDVLTNEDYSKNFTQEKIDKINIVNEIIDDSLNKVKYSSKDLSDKVGKLNNNFDSKLVDLVYIYYGAKNDYNNEWKISIEKFISYLSNNVITDKKFSSFINDDKKETIKQADKKINKSKKLLVSKNYSRAIFNTKYAFENKETYKFVESMKDRFNNKDIYVVGNSPMAVEMSKSFNSELNKITILTMIFIFLVVAITFKDLIIPLILVLIIQTAVYITMGAIAITGGNVYFISLIIVQAILMGATIDYAIVFTSYYRENRERKGIKESIISAYNKSIHTIISSASILIIVTMIVSNFASAIAAKICETVSQGTIAATLLVLLVLPGTLAATDKLICRGNKYKK